MNRRTFVRRGGGAALALSAGLPAPAGRARPLRRGDRIGLVTPASATSAANVERAEANLRTLGFEPVRTDAPLLRHGEFAGTDAQRAADLHGMYADPTVRGIWAIRGGYGTNRLLDRLDFRLIKRHPKPLIGYSDLTTLLNVIHAKTGAPCFHGPVGSSPLNDYVRAHAAPLTGAARHTISLPEYPEPKGPLYEYAPLLHGVATGPLVGGNLTLLSSLAGTGWLPKTKGALVFLEDVGERPYRIDRMLTQLTDAGFFDKVRGIALGVFKGCGQTDPDRHEDYSLQVVLRDRLERFGVPIAYGFPVGHVDRQCFLPIGVSARMDTRARTLELLESAYA